MTKKNVDYTNAMSLMELSDEVYELFNSRMSLMNLKTNKYSSISISLMYIMKNTSQVIRYLIKNSLVIPAVTLARVRLEQAIVFSYLVHAEESIGFQPFIAHIPISEYLKSSLAITEQKLAKNLTELDLEILKLAAKSMQARFSSESEGERFDKKWTKLDLLSMASARDHMTRDLDEVLSYGLEIDYKSLYKEASSLVHFDGNSILTYTNYNVSRDEEHLIIGSKSTWAPMAAAFNAHYDIINIFETAKILNINNNEELQEVNYKYKLQIEKLYLGDSEKANDIT